MSLLSDTKLPKDRVEQVLDIDRSDYPSEGIAGQAQFL
jgi:hypothetical protein